MLHQLVCGRDEDSDDADDDQRAMLPNPNSNSLSSSPQSSSPLIVQQGKCDSANSNSTNDSQVLALGETQECALDPSVLN